MFGSYRFFLSLLVVIHHFNDYDVYWTGVYAVFGFFLLSGYLMTMVLNVRYGYSVGGVTDFITNRALRIYPPYLLMVGVGALLIAIAPVVAKDVIVYMVMPESWSQWSVNVFIFGLDYKESSRLLPQGWSLEVELIFYIAMALAFSRARSFTLLWFLVSVAYTIFQIVADAHFTLRFYTVEAASLSFATGAMIYHFRDAIKRAMGVKTVLITAALYVAHSFGSDTLYGGDVGVVHIGFYVSLLLSALLTASLMTIDPGQIPEKWRRVDDTLGDLSYPVFLTHFNVAILLSMFFQFDPVADGPLFFALSIIPVLLVSWGLHISVERLMEPTRDSIRARARLRREQRLALENQ